MIASCVDGCVMQQCRRCWLQRWRLPTFSQIGFHALERVAQGFDLLFRFRRREALGGMDERGGPA
jgi:hypothetical protein